MGSKRLTPLMMRSSRLDCPLTSRKRLIGSTSREITIFRSRSSRGRKTTKRRRWRIVKRLRRRGIISGLRKLRF